MVSSTISIEFLYSLRELSLELDSDSSELLPEKEGTDAMEETDSIEGTDSTDEIDSTDATDALATDGDDRLRTPRRLEASAVAAARRRHNNGRVLIESFICIFLLRRGRF